MADAKDSKGLLLVFVEPSSALPDSEFHDWYENEHIPLRTALPSIHSATRFIAADDQKPTWGAAYDLESLSSLTRPAYAELALTRSNREKEVLKRVQFLERRMYELLDTAPKTTSEGHSSKELKPGQLVVLVSFDVAPEDEADLHDWYNTEHIHLLSKVPGWLRSRRFMLREADANVDAATYKKPPQFLAIHEYDNPKATETEEWKVATSTPWRHKVVDKAGRVERRMLSVYKNF